MTVVDTRRNLNEMRKMWRANTPSQPFCTSAKLSDGRTVSEFAFAFVCSHHRSREGRRGPDPAARADE